ncbi:response regulator transcription factor [Dactylosporangium roseum]|uniref:Response regulator transcription factor n=1 Tax=Dactylosporangium roseum TaxID=47989 RepID=A0ABY5ZBP1_9ACTN|nr:response regulator transcription factor [Dactylosporangium roseum]UWZ39535.1 response regulator transcription factor [Dactylosporangium roseum]
MRIILADDAVLLREGLVALLTRFHHDVVAVGDAAALADAVDAERPDVVVTDVRMPPSYTDEGLHAAVALRVRHPGLPVLVLSQYVATAYAAKLLESTHPGGVGYLLKDRILDVADFVDGVERVAAGGCVVDPEVVRQLLTRRHDPLRRLTPREREVLALMAEGRSNAAITTALTISEKVVGKHINAIFTKLDLPADCTDDHRRVRAVLTYLQRKEP